MRSVRFTGLLGLLPFPECCPACRGTTGAGFCGACAGEFGLIRRPCRICGLPQPVTHCPREAAPWLVDRMCAPFEYAYPLDHYLQALKFGHGRILGRALALLLRAPLRLALERGALTADTFVPVPLHAQRLRERGYNQAAEIARTLAAELGPSVAVAGVHRARGATAQSSLGARARRANVAGAFRVVGPFSGRRIAIVDDVITTGATINALAAALLAAGAESVAAVAIARTVAATSVLPGKRRADVCGDDG